MSVGAIEGTQGIQPVANPRWCPPFLEWAPVPCFPEQPFLDDPRVSLVTLTASMDHTHYYHAPDLARFPEVGKGAPELWEKFLAWYGAVFAEGALTAREKALIALAVSHTVQCPYCIDAYTTASLEHGSNEEQMTEAIHVAAAIRGGSSLVHGVQMRNHLERLGM